MIGRKGDALRNGGLWKVKGKYEVTAIMVQRVVGEDDVWKGALVAKI